LKTTEVTEERPLLKRIFTTIAPTLTGIVVIIALLYVLFDVFRLVKTPSLLTVFSLVFIVSLLVGTFLSFRIERLALLRTIFYSPGLYIALFVIANEVLPIMFGGEAAEIVAHGGSRCRLLIRVLIASDSLIVYAGITCISAVGVWAGHRLESRTRNSSVKELNR
jgi:hypothetical protein